MTIETIPVKTFMKHTFYTKKIPCDIRMKENDF